ncbi:hypothetical protein Dimus_012236 [Dionaea muscipula]
MCSEKQAAKGKRHCLIMRGIRLGLVSLALLFHFRSEPANIENQVGNNQASGSSRARRDAAARARAMQGWHSSQRLLGNGEVSDPIPIQML